MREIFYFFFGGIPGPVTTPGFEGAFQGSTFTTGSQPNTGFIRITGAKSRPEFYRFCVNERRISSLDIMGSEDGYTFDFGTLTGIIISSVRDVPFNDIDEFEVFFFYQSSGRATQNSNAGYKPPATFGARVDIPQRVIPARFGVAGAVQVNKTTETAKRPPFGRFF